VSDVRHMALTNKQVANTALERNELLHATWHASETATKNPEGNRCNRSKHKIYFPRLQTAVKVTVMFRLQIQSLIQSFILKNATLIFFEPLHNGWHFTSVNNQPPSARVPFVLPL
jgi:hypothetical protein